MRRTIFLFAILFIQQFTVFAQTPKYEVRAVWLTTLNGLDWPSVKATNSEAVERQKRQLTTILDQLARANVNTILFQTRVRGTTIYPSQIEPWDGCLTGTPGRNPGYDPLQFAIDECHKRGMELHAWVVAIPVGKWNALGCKRLRERYSSLIHKIGDEGYMNPEKPQTGEYIANICGEIIDKYDVDGIHLDYIRYPENWKQTVSKDRGRSYITGIVRQIHSRVKGNKPWIKLSCSPIGKYSNLTRYPSRGWNAYDVVCQDAQGWLREGLMDQLYPMMYFKGDNYYPFAVDWADNTYGRTVVTGLGVWLLSRKEGSNWPLIEITRELNVSRDLGMGHCYFRSRFFTDNVKGLYTYVSRDFDKYPALTPPMTWQSSILPSPPRGISLNSEGSNLRIRWWGAKNNSNSPTLYYNVYCSTQFPVDTKDVRNLIAHHLTKESLSIRDDDGRHYYAVTVMDRYGNESAPVRSNIIVEPTIEYLKNDGTRLQLPEIDRDYGTRYIRIESLAGNAVLLRAYTSTTKEIIIRTLPDGVYRVKAVDKNKVARHIGQFIIKRL